MKPGWLRSISSLLLMSALTPGVWAQQPPPKVTVALSEQREMLPTVTPFADRLGGAVSHVVATNGSLVTTFPEHPGVEPELLDAELASQEVQGELYLVGGAVMCLALDARAAVERLRVACHGPEPDFHVSPPTPDAAPPSSGVRWASNDSPAGPPSSANPNRGAASRSTSKGWSTAS